MRSRTSIVLGLGLLLLAASPAAAFRGGGFGGGVRFGGAGMHLGAVGHGFGTSGLPAGFRPFGSGPGGGVSHFSVHPGVAPGFHRFAFRPRFFPHHGVSVDGFHHHVFVDGFHQHVFVDTFFFAPFSASFFFASPGVVVTASPFFFSPFGTFVTAPFFCFPCGFGFATEALFLDHIRRVHHLHSQLARSFPGRAVVFVGA